MNSFETQFMQRVALVDEAIEAYWQTFMPKSQAEKTHAEKKHAERCAGLNTLIEALSYSVSSGGKRFRPVLCLLTAEILGGRDERVLPFALSVEFVHTYSLIHDDLPCMDNDDLRRGLPTNHKVFGEATALLAGDALLTEAFSLIASAYGDEPHVAISLVKTLACASGVRGMVGGQSIDMVAKKATLTRSDIQKMHEMKTGALIAASVAGAAHACGAEASQAKHLTAFGHTLGLAFQVADDILDSTPGALEPGSYPALIGLEQTRAFLSELTEKALSELAPFGEKARALRWIAEFNLDRTD